MVSGNSSRWLITCVRNTTVVYIVSLCMYIYIYISTLYIYNKSNNIFYNI
jgi:hypothetical protein